MKNSSRYYNTSIRNLTYRLRAFRDELPIFLESIIRDKEDVIISAVADDQLYRRGINGRGVKIMDYQPYKPRTIEIKKLKGQPTTRVTLRDTGSFHKSMRVEYTPEGFYITSDDYKTEMLKEKYGPEIMRLTDKNLTRILRVHIRRELGKRIKEVTKKQ